jgi:hypothetical protein
MKYLLPLLGFTVGVILYRTLAWSQDTPLHSQKLTAWKKYTEEINEEQRRRLALIADREAS